MKALDPKFDPFDKDISGPIPFLKITGQLPPAHRIENFVNRDTTTYDFIGSFDTAKFQREWIGGWGYSGRITSVWTSWLTSRIGYSWNNKTFGRSLVNTSLTSRRVFREVQLSSGRLTGV